MKMNIADKQRRSAILYARVKPGNRDWFESEMKKKGYEFISEFMDTVIEAMRDGSGPKVRQKKNASSKSKAA